MGTHVLVEDKVFVIPEFLSPQRCQTLIELSEARGYADAPVTTRQGPVHMPDVRNNERVMFDDPAMAREFWDHLNTFTLPQLEDIAPSGLNERLRFYRYDPGQTFRPHRDGSFRRPDGSEQSWYTVLVYLNEGYTGGETIIYGHDLVIKPKTGLALIFYHPLLHEGAEVTSGRKYVIRTDLMFPTSPH